MAENPDPYTEVLADLNARSSSRDPYADIIQSLNQTENPQPAIQDQQLQSQTAQQSGPNRSIISSTPAVVPRTAASPTRPIAHRGNIASVTVTPDSPGRIIDRGVVQQPGHPTPYQASHRGDSIQIDAADLLDQLNHNRITPQQFYRAFQDRYAAGIGFNPADQEAMRQYYRSLGSDYDPFSFAATPDELVAQARKGKGFINVGRSPDVIRHFEAFRHSSLIDPMGAMIRDATSPQAELDRATQALISKGIDPNKIQWEGELDPDSQLRIVANDRGAGPELQRYFDARSRLHPGLAHQLTMDIGSAATAKLQRSRILII